MNRYVVNGLLADARAGRRVILIGRVATEEWDILADAAREDGAQVRVAQADRRVSYPPSGGGITHSRTFDGMRGRTADTVVIINRVKGLETAEREGLHAVLAGGTDNEVVWL